MKKFKIFINYDKEEKWLNSMAKSGYELMNVSFGYVFRHAEPEDAVIRIDYRTFKNQADFLDYCSLFEDSGWKHIAGTKYSGAQYFKKISWNDEEDIFSDDLSRAGKYKRLSDMWMSLAAVYAPIAVVFMSNGTFSISKLTNPKALYLTPGLWKMTGTKFWTHFLFETPFALMRGFSWMIFVLIAFLYIFFAIKARRLYHKQRKSS